MKKTFEEIWFNNSESKELLKDLRTKITKYNGKYSSKEFKEYLESLLVLDIDILKDNTYNEEQIEELKKIKIFRRLINFNVYGSMRKLLSDIDECIVWPGTIYKEDITWYPVWKNEEEILTLDFLSQIEENKTVITLPQETIISPNVRYEQIDKLIEHLYETYKKTPEIKNLKKWYYHIKLGCIIDQLSSLRARRDDLTKEQKIINKYNLELYKKMDKEYGPFENTFHLDHRNEKIIIDEKGNIISTTTVKETPIATFQKKIIYH